MVSDNFSCTTPNGFIDIDPAPPANYTYNWSNNLKTQDLNNLPAGTYTVTVTLGTCNAVASFDVYNAAVLPNLAVSSTPAVCGQSNGSASVSASGASAPYTYKWSNNGMTATISNLPPQVYTVTVTDFFGCSSTATVTVGNNIIALNISGTPAANTSCSAANGGVNITVTPAGSYTYNWSNTTTAEDLINVAAGSYTVTASAGVGCTASATFAVTNNTSDPAIAAAITPSICGLNNGGIDLSVSGATAPYTFAWSNTATSEDLANILSGTYSVTVTGANGCTSDTTLVVVNNASTFSLSGSATPLTNCATANGAIDLIVTPAGTYTYQWSTTATPRRLRNPAIVRPRPPSSSTTNARIRRRPNRWFRKFAASPTAASISG